MSTRYLIWDFDGTLAHRPGLWGATLAQVAQCALPGCGITEADVRPYLRAGFPWHQPDQPHPRKLSADEWWEALVPLFETAYAQGGGLAAAEARELSRRVRAHYLDVAYWHVFEDSLPALEGLRSQGWRHVLLSNHVPELAGLLDALGLLGYMDRIYNSAETGFEKPHPQAFRNVIEALPRGADVWMIGDSFHADFSGARAAGIRAVLVRNPRPACEPYCDGLDSLPGILVRS